MQHSCLAWGSGVRTYKRHMRRRRGGGRCHCCTHSPAHIANRGRVLKYTNLHAQIHTEVDFSHFFWSQQQFLCQAAEIKIRCNIRIEVFTQLYFHCSLKSAQRVRYCIAVWKICVVSPPLSVSLFLVSRLKRGVGVLEGTGWRRSLWCDYKDTQQASGNRWKRQSRSKIDPGGKAKEEEMHSLFSSARYRR